jgi:hypothetical protein
VLSLARDGEPGSDLPSVSGRSRRWVGGMSRQHAPHRDASMPREPQTSQRHGIGSPASNRFPIDAARCTCTSTAWSQQPQDSSTRTQRESHPDVSDAGNAIAAACAARGRLTMTMR